MVDLVAKLVAMDKKNINLQNKDGDTVLHISVWQMNEKIVELLICDELKIDIQNNSNRDGPHFGNTFSHATV